eukprot:jgi/Tetstr1/427685/TSEL_017810.t1
MAYRGSDGKFLPRNMNASEALNAGPNGDKYQVSTHYEGKASNCNASIAEPNPYWFKSPNGEKSGDSPYPQTGRKLSTDTVESHFKK